MPCLCHPHPSEGDVALVKSTPSCSRGHLCKWSYSKFLPGNESPDPEEGNAGGTPQHPLYSLLNFSSVVH